MRVGEPKDRDVTGPQKPMTTKNPTQAGSCCSVSHALLTSSSGSQPTGLKLLPPNFAYYKSHHLKSWLLLHRPPSHSSREEILWPTWSHGHP